MPIIYNAAVKTARMTATRDHFAGGTLELQAANNAILAIFSLSAIGGTISNGVWTVTFDNTTVEGEVGAATGTAATKAVIKDDGGNAHLTGLIVSHSSGDGDVKMTNTSIASGQSVSITSATVTHAADPE